MQIFDIAPADLNDVFRLNEASLPHVGRVDFARMEWFALHAQYFRGVRLNEELAGFLIGLRPGLPYESPNYRWFVEHYDDFAYVDRVAVAESARRKSIASRLYDDFAATVPRGVKYMTCEVNLRPPNETSMRFHERLGFVRVGSLESEGGKKEVALLEKRL